ncbi:hypothetical protein MTO96_047216 [Rhipicephalus appendiculatus]
MSWGLLILNIYTDERFYGLIGKAVKMATDAGIPLVVAGDFHAPHSTWGYVRDSPKGTSICKTTQDFNLTLLTDPGFPTRLGNSVTRPSTADLLWSPMAASRHGETWGKFWVPIISSSK